MPLKLTLKPNEKVVIGQAVIVNGKSTAQFMIQNKVPVLREKGILNEKSANSPAKRIYFVCQMMYMFPESIERYRRMLGQLVGEFLSAAPSAAPLIMEIGDFTAKGDHYRALKSCQKLIDYESGLIANARRA